MNRSKKEKERLRKRQNRIQQNQQHTAQVSAGTTHPVPSTLPTTRQQVPSCSSPTVTLHRIQQTPTQDPCCPPRLPQSTQQTQCQLDGPQIHCHIADTTSQIVNMVGDENTEITDDVIEAMLNLMKAFSNDHNINIGFFTPAEIRLYSSDPTSYIRKIPMNRDCLLVHPLTGHWVTSVYRKDSNTVTVYDSMRTENHYYEIRNQIRVFYGNDIASRLQYVPVQQQNHMSICGGMALAFATAIFHATDPRTFNYDISKIRGHIRACLSNGIIQQFPLLPTLSTPSMSTVRYTPSVSSVSMPTLSTPSVSSVKQKTWTPLLENYFDKQNCFDQMHRTNTVNSQTKKADNMKDTLRKQQQRNKMNDIEKRNALQKDKQRKKQKRSRMSETEKRDTQNKDKMQHQQKRSRMSETEKRDKQNENTVQHQQKRSRISEREKRDIQNRNKVQHQQKRSRISETEKRAKQNENTVQHQQKRSRISEKEKRDIQNKDTLQHQQKRSRMSETEKHDTLNKNKVQHQQKRSQISETEKRAKQNENTVQHQQKRSRISEKEKRDIQNKDTLQHQQKRSRMSETEKRDTQNKNKVQHQQKRSRISETEKRAKQNENTLQHQQKRSGISEKEKRDIQNKDTLQHQQKRSRMSETEKT